MDGPQRNRKAGGEGKKLLSSPELQTAFELCELGVGGELSRHPKYLLESLSADEWADWLAWRKIFPSPQSRADINTALIRKSSLDPHCKGKIDAVKLMPRYGGSRRKLRTGAEMAAAARAWCESVNRPDRKVSW